MINSKQIVVRFPPSPTGLMHIGTMRSLLFNFLYAKRNNGKIVLRIEDTDRERSKQEYTNDLFENLKWLSLSYDEPVYYQSKRGDIYSKYLQELIDKNVAYVSKEVVKEEGQRAEVIRFRNPNKVITFTDIIRGEITFDTTELGDFIIARSVTEPLYHFAVIVDDYEMDITHIIRGEDHISNTPRQILLQEAIGAPLPAYAHLPLILASDKSKLSKRKHGEFVSTTFYRNEGYLPEALINFLALMGWNPGTDQELFSMQELLEQFSLERVQKSGAIFNIEKLNWLNKQYIKEMGPADFHKMVLEFLPKSFKNSPAYLGNPEVLPALEHVLKERLVKFGDLKTMIENNELQYFFLAPIIQKEKISYKKSTDEETATVLDRLIKLIERVTTFSDSEIKAMVEPLALEVGRGVILHPMRYSLSGLEKSPDPFTIASIIGKDETISRLKEAIIKITR